MFHIRRTADWARVERQATAEEDVLNRRAFLARAGGAVPGSAVAMVALSAAQAQQTPPGQTPYKTTLPKTPTRERYPAKRNDAYQLDRPLTGETVAATYNNFYEFTTSKADVYRLAEKMKVRPWTVEVTGLVKQPRTWDIDALVRALPLEERLYRFRCVEAWAMAVPWTGIPMKAFVKLVEPKSSARFLRLTSVIDKPVMPGVAGPSAAGYPYPYHEGLTLAEATNELALLATGIYGHELPKQHGAPIRLIVPWKYGFKNIKSIVRIEFTDDKPNTFWNDAVPDEYGFYANINPKVPHKRWSQASETLIGTGERRATLLYNGYAEQVAALYRGVKNQFY